jgi:DNA-binding IclR family transcriptional regulator
MGQAEILAWLVWHPGWHHSSEIAAAMGIHVSKVRDGVGRLRSWGEVEYMDENRRRRLWRVKPKAGAK